MAPQGLAGLLSDAHAGIGLCRHLCFQAGLVGDPLVTLQRQMPTV